MNDKTKLAGVALGIIAIILGITALTRPTPQKVVERIVEKATLGSLTGPDINSPYLSFNGIVEMYAKGDCRDATSTLFSVNPFWGIGSSTVEFSKYDLTALGTSTALATTIATSTVATTTLVNANVNANTLYEEQQGYARATSLAGTATTTSGIINGVNFTATTTAFGGIRYTDGGTSLDANTQGRLPVGKYEKVIGWIEPLTSGAAANILGSVTNPQNQFQCSYEFIFRR